MRDDSVSQQLIRYYNDAFNVMTTDATSSANKARKAAELICKDILKNNNIIFDETSMLWDLMRHVNENHLWPDPRMQPLIKSIQQVANYASHHNKIKLIRADIEGCMITFSRLLYFYLGSSIEIPMIELGDPSSMQPIRKPQDFTVAYSHLTVIEAITLNWDIKNTFAAYGLKVHNVERKWNDTILEELENGYLDMAIYNKNRAIKYNGIGGDRLHILRDVCVSMGGNNFYVLALKGGKWKPMDIEAFRSSLDENTVVALSKSSDRLDNFLFAVNSTEQELIERGVKFVEYDADKGLDVFDLSPDILLVGGQDVRIMAEKEDRFFEIVNCDMLPQKEKRFFYEQAINSIVVGESGYNKFHASDIDDILDKLVLNFYKNVSIKSKKASTIEKLERTVRARCLDDISTKYVIERILFETYRI